MKSSFKLILPLLLIVAMNEKIFAQRLKIGDRMPDIEIKNVNNYLYSHFKISDFKGKLLILDFWGVYCAPCIAAIPEMEALQEKFKDRIQVVLVTENTDAEVEKLRNRSAILKNIQLPFINGDTILSKLFPYVTVPMHVWIDGSGIIREITNGYNTTEGNVRDFLSGKRLILPVKNENPALNTDNPLWWLTKNGEENKSLLYYTVILGRNTEKESSVIGLQSDSVLKENTGVSCFNIPVVQLYQFAYGEGFTRFFRNRYRTILELPNAMNYYPPDDMSNYDAWADKNLFCYALKLPPSRANQLFSIMQQDLESFFELKGKIEKRRVKCLELIRISSNDKIHANSGMPLVEINPEETRLIIHNLPMDNLVTQLELINNKSGYSYFVDKTHYRGNINIEIQTNLTNIHSVKTELRKYGLDLVERYLKEDILIIRSDIK